MTGERKVALVTGGTRGIGKAVALALGMEGLRVAIVGRSSERAREAAADLLARKVEARDFALDVSDGAAVDACVREVQESWGGLHVLVNNAGITRDGLLLRMSDSDWDDVIDVNLKGVFHFTRAAARVMTRQRYGRVINISSVVGEMGNPGQANYAASKAGILGFTKAVAKELAPRGITVNAVSPGFIETDMTAGLSDASRVKVLETIPLTRFGTPEDVARAVLFLAMESGDYITGQVIRVDGGMVMA